MALLLVECRALYTNAAMCTWVEESFKLFFKETHTELRKNAQQEDVQQAVDDLFNMLVLEDKK